MILDNLILVNLIFRQIILSKFWFQSLQGKQIHTFKERRVAMHKLYMLRDTLCEELEEVAKKGSISTSDLDTIDKLAHSIKNLDKILMGEGSYNSYGYDRSMMAAMLVEVEMVMDATMKEEVVIIVEKTIVEI